MTAGESQRRAGYQGGGCKQLGGDHRKRLFHDISPSHLHSH
jgi:hypothetical protein